MDIQVEDRITYRLKIGEYKGVIQREIISSPQERKAYLKMLENNEIEIFTIERPKYEVVEEVSVTDKELLTEEEKTALKDMIENINKFSCVKIKQIYLYNISNYLVVRFFNKDFFICDIATTYEFKELERSKKYTLKELGLED